jgi:hypothetical protein
MNSGICTSPEYRPPCGSDALYNTLCVEKGNVRRNKVAKCLNPPGRLGYLLASLAGSARGGLVEALVLGDPGEEVAGRLAGIAVDQWPARGAQAARSSGVLADSSEECRHVLERGVGSQVAARRWHEVLVPGG